MWAGHDTQAIKLRRYASKSLNFLVRLLDEVADGNLRECHAREAVLQIFIATLPDIEGLTADEKDRMDYAYEYANLVVGELWEAGAEVAGDDRKHLGRLPQDVIRHFDFNYEFREDFSQLGEVPEECYQCKICDTHDLSADMFSLMHFQPLEPRTRRLPIVNFHAC